jgi:hypothetical protein
VSKTADAAAPAPRPEGYADDGVDVTLIRWMLSLSPAGRLHALQSAAASVVKLRESCKR